MTLNTLSAITARTGYYQLSTDGLGGSTYSQALGGVVSVERFSNRGGGASIRRAVLTFDISELSDGLIIDSVNLSYDIGLSTPPSDPSVRFSTIVDPTDNEFAITAKWLLHPTASVYNNDGDILTGGSNSISLGGDAVSDLTTAYEAKGLFSLVFYYTDTSNLISSDLTNIKLLITTSLSFTPRSPASSDVVVSQDDSIATVSRSQNTIFTNPSVDGDIVESGTHTKTHYQIFEKHVSITEAPMINLISNSSVRQNGNLKSLSKDKMEIILKSGTYYKMRKRFFGRINGSNRWSSWTPVVTFRTRDKDYKYTKTV